MQGGLRLYVLNDRTYKKTDGEADNGAQERAGGVSSN